MKTMDVEKRILKDCVIDQLLNLSASEDLRIQIENDGKRCIGYVDIKGQYLTNDEVFDFREYIDCDIFAPSYKCNDETFLVRLVDVSGEVNDGILVKLSFEIDGLNDEDQLKVEDEEMDLMGLEDLFEENENLYTNCTLIVAKDTDTYESIAQKYQISVSELKKANNEVQIKSKQCILIPKS
ncbi:MAG: LysM peptidoglycan-binding domain-containing protein [Traorella sp.]